MEDDQAIEVFNGYMDDINNSKEEKIEKYMNASWINSATEEKAFIAAMPPVETYIPAFWQMVMENNVTLMIMVAKREDEVVSLKKKKRKSMQKEEK